MPRQALPKCDPDLKASGEPVRALQEADVDKARKMLTDWPDPVWANHLMHWACRVPGYEGHGGQTPDEGAKGIARAQLVRLFVDLGTSLHAEQAKGDLAPHGLPLRARPCSLKLLEIRADPNATDEVRPPLYRAMNLGDPLVVEALLQGGADPNVQNLKSYTPLHRASMQGKLPIVPLFLKHGADRNILDREGKKPIDHARNNKIIDLLEEQP